MNSETTTSQQKNDRKQEIARQLMNELCTSRGSFVDLVGHKWCKLSPPASSEEVRAAIESLVLKGEIKVCPGCGGGDLIKTNLSKISQPDLRHFAH